MATTVTSLGKKKIQTNDGSVQLNLNDNRILQYDGDKYRFVIGKKNDGESKVTLSKEGENVLNV